MNERTHLDIFSGLGAWTISSAMLGIKTIGFCETDERCKSFLGRAWPGIPVFPDVRKLDGRQFRGVDLLTAGVPCQPASRGGEQRGAADDRWLWGETLRLVREAKPRVVICENPPGIGDVGLCGILAELEAEGYEIAPIFDIPACALNSPQLRHRYYIVAYASESGRERAGAECGQNGCSSQHSQSDAANPNSRCGEFGQGEPQRGPEGRDVDRGIGAGNMGDTAEARPTQTLQAESGNGSRRVRKPERAMPADNHLANATESGLRQRCADRGRQSEGMGANGRGERSADNGSGNLADSERAGCERGTAEPGEAQSGWTCPETTRLYFSHWDNYVWLPCADGKVRRAPGCPVCVAARLPGELPAELGQTQEQGCENLIEAHRSLIGALGNSQVPQIAYMIVKAAMEVLDP
jgi:site-specific DNA-cytosine methylase